MHQRLANALSYNEFKIFYQPVFEMQTGFADSGKLEYFALEDNVDQAGATYSVFFAKGWRSGASGTIKLGADRQERTRDFNARRFRFVANNVSRFDLTLTPDEIYTPENIGPGGFELRENTGVNDAYDAEHTVDAGFAMTDVTFGRWRVIGGARYERSTQSVSTCSRAREAKAATSSRAPGKTISPARRIWRASAVSSTSELVSP